ncbi:glycosyltransferase family 2 protein [Candidatus Uhrbacteria bacterium]|nr:glycosyltransferase family 2 protein [Candidatus Uhrbacteria bacterium]
MTSPDTKVVAVIPAYNEGRTIAKVIQGVRQVVDEVVVVDDCSKDDTGVQASSAGAHVMRHETNGGYDKSIDDGFKEAAKLGAGIIVTCDADGQHRPEDITKVLEPILKGEADVVAGQRDKTTRLGEKIFAVYTRYRFGLRDPLCGLKAYRREVYDKVGHFDTLGSIGTQLLAEAWKNGYRVATVPVIILPRPDESRFYAKLFRANVKILKAMFKIIRLTLWKTKKQV